MVNASHDWLGDKVYASQLHDEHEPFESRDDDVLLIDTIFLIQSDR